MAGEVITLTASPANGWLVGSWMGTNNDASVATMNTLVMPAGSHSVTVNYIDATRTILSTNTYDGWILESSETSGTGGTMNKTATTFNLGDNAANKQYRSILSFDTSALPDNAVITSVTLKFKYAGKTGTLPFSTHGNLLADVRRGPFSNRPTLQLGDFAAKGTLTTYKAKVLTYTNSLIDNWYSQSLLPADYQFINLVGVTQFRLRFSKDDNNDFGADFLKIFSGNTPEADRPQLIIEYYVP